MSGIAGIHSTDGRPIEVTDLNHMLATLKHRGPDGCGSWCEGPVGLGHRMFQETPESLLEQQPCFHAEARLALTADARIDNRDQLIRQLDLAAEDPALLSDSRLILLAYARWGEDCVDHLLGDFAFALWDGRQHALFCARDYIGVKPFYYAFLKNRFLFASEPKGTLCLQAVPDELNDEMIANYLANDLEDKEITFHKGLFRLPPAHVLRVDKQGLRFRRYWQPDNVRELRLSSDDEYAQAFRETFSESIRCRLRSAFPVGSDLSGGMDSSSVTCMARDLLALEGQGRKLKTFSATFDHIPRVDEGRYQDSVIAAGGIEPHKVSMEHLGPLRSYLDGQLHMDYPYQGYSYYMSAGLHSKMNDDGVRILLEGLGGDDVVNHGYAFLSTLARGLQLARCYREGRAFAKVHGYPVSHVLWRLGVRPVTPTFLLSLWHLLRYGEVPQQTPLLRDSTISRGLLERTGVMERAREQALAANKPLTLRERHGKAFTSGLVAFVFEEADHLGYARSLVARHPFYDRRLAELCLSMPHDQKLSGGWTRVVLRRAMEGILPAENQWRTDKSDLSPHFHSKLRGQERELLLETVEHVTPLIAPYVDVETLRDQCSRYLSDNQTNNLYLPIWSAVTFGAFLLKRSRQPLEKGETQKG